MTTDITKLAQLRAELSNPAVGSKDHLRKLALSLVEALELKEQQRNGELETYSKTAIEFREAARDESRHLKLELEIAEKRIAKLESRTVTVTAAAADVLAERKRQVSVEGWTPSHDDAHKNNEMAFAAACYAFHAAAASWDLEDCGTDYDSHPAPKNWPWEPEWWKPKSARADLVRAGALILAELERIDRAAGIKVEAE
ncbi:TPA: hypothetical protein ACXP60_001079 [Klebsiella variicola subsp. variicola]|uniref:hypothetical protein n=1 Tax=Klebsiella variicola TaxID=244366 RepID=UPI0027E72457|nr:hypothetical protein [Raoultella ornithinolytica]HDU4292909.1 hypothetical protein [Klebsiella variicola]